MSEQVFADERQTIELGSQVTTPYGVGIVTWVEVGGDEFQVMMYDNPAGLFGPKVYKTVDRAHIAFWPARPANGGTP